LGKGREQRGKKETTRNRNGGGWQGLETVSFFHSMKSLMPASDLQVNQSLKVVITRLGFFLVGRGNEVLEKWTMGCIKDPDKVWQGPGVDATGKETRMNHLVP
jgi:hypothetical protein